MTPVSDLGEVTVARIGKRLKYRVLKVDLREHGERQCQRADPGGVLVCGLILQGIARSSLTTIAILTLVETPQVGETRAATASGMFFSAAEVGGASGPVMLGLMHSATGSFQPALGLLTVVAGLLLIGAHQIHIASRKHVSG